MKAADIYVFSGTGNTLLAARALKSRLAERGITARLKPLEKSNPAEADVTRAVGLACPVAMQGTYPMVWDFVRALPAGSGADFFMLDTLRMFSGGILGPMRRLVKRKGYRPAAAAEIIMPINMFRPGEINGEDRALIEKALVKVRDFADALAGGAAAWPRPKIWEWFFFAMMKMSFAFCRAVKKWLGPRVDSAKCRHCGLCARLCPANAVTLMEKTPVFAGACQFCVRCAAYCPANAIRIFGARFPPYRPVDANDFLGQGPKKAAAK